MADNVKTSSQIYDELNKLANQCTTESLCSEFARLLDRAESLLRKESEITRKLNLINSADAKQNISDSEQQKNNEAREQLKKDHEALISECQSLSADVDRFKDSIKRENTRQLNNKQEEQIASGKFDKPSPSNTIQKSFSLSVLNKDEVLEKSQLVKISDAIKSSYVLYKQQSLLTAQAGSRFLDKLFDLSDSILNFENIEEEALNKNITLAILQSFYYKENLKAMLTILKELRYKIQLSNSRDWYREFKQYQTEQQPLSLQSADSEKPTLEEKQAKLRQLDRDILKLSAKYINTDERKADLLQYKHVHKYDRLNNITTLTFTNVQKENQDISRLWASALSDLESVKNLIDQNDFVAVSDFNAAYLKAIQSMNLYESLVNKAIQSAENFYATVKTLVNTKE
ncbi:MAG: hypothetical protein MJZ34_02845 [Paludibacteraceae bacterium]|nr:hypothetical protein [Paludibacteraceae bacterium]